MRMSAGLCVDVIYCARRLLTAGRGGQLIFALNGERGGSVPIVLAVVGAFALDALQFAGAASKGPRAAAADQDFPDRRDSFELHKDCVAVGHQRHRITAIAAGGGADVFRDDRIEGKLGIEVSVRIC